MRCWSARAGACTRVHAREGTCGEVLVGARLAADGCGQVGLGEQPVRATHPARWRVVDGCEKVSGGITISTRASGAVLVIVHLVEEGDIELRLVESWLNALVAPCYVTEPRESAILQES